MDMYIRTYIHIVCLAENFFEVFLRDRSMRIFSLLSPQMWMSVMRILTASVEKALSVSTYLAASDATVSSVGL